MSSAARPVTSKPRGVCRFYTTQRGCFAGDSCKFLHAELPVNPKPDDPPLLTPYDKSKKCRYYAQGFCKRGDSCWFIHVSDSKDKAPMNDEEEEEEFCSICFEKPAIYGLLGGCNHIFCITCIKQWRDPQNKPGEVIESGNTKKCPMCRSPSRFITPSSKFCKEGTPEKAHVVQAYKESMGRVPCKYFQKSLEKDNCKPMCPYGKDCFYQHIKEDGSPFVFTDGVDVSMRKYRTFHRPEHNHFIHFLPSFIGPPLFVDGSTIPGARNRDQRGNHSPPERRRNATIHPEGINSRLQELNSVTEALRQELAQIEDGSSGIDVTQMGDQEIMNYLAEHMIASMLYTDPVNLRPDTPPPGLEPTTPAVNEPRPVRPPTRTHPDNASDDSMPSMQSVSDSSDEDEDNDDDVDEQEQEEDPEHESDVAADTDDYILEWLQTAEANASGPEISEAYPNGSPSVNPEPGPSRFSTVVGRAASLQLQFLQPSTLDDESDEEPPPLEPIVPATENEESSCSKASDVPFTTDGRGRVISVGGAESASASGLNEGTKDDPSPLPLEESGKDIPPFTTDGRGRVISASVGEQEAGSTGAEEGGAQSPSGSGRTLLNWIGGLF